MRHLGGDADGTGNTNLTNTSDKSEFSPAWSADGTRLAFFEGTNGVDTLTVMNADGTGRQPVTTTNAWPYGSRPTWSPGGTQIAFVRNNPGSPVSIQADIVVIDLTTRTETVITHPVDFGGALADADEIEPAWSPDGSKLVFMSQAQIPACCGPWQI